jgi:hypothetical protein
MPIQYRETTAILTEFVTVDDAENLLGWIQEHRKFAIDLAGCTHLHAADLQVLLAARAEVVAWPNEESLRGWIEPAFTCAKGER